MADKHVEFVGTIIRKVFDTDNYKMYAVEVNKFNYPDIKFTVYGNALICGNLHELSMDSEYVIQAIEKNDSKGYKYVVTNIKKTELKSEQDVYNFLQEILTFNQASELYKHYPQIVDLVINGRDDEVDLNKLHGIKQYTFNIIKEKIIENYKLFDLITEFKGVLTMSMMKRLYEKYPSIEKIREEIRKHPYKCLCGLSRVGFKTADSLLLDMEKQGVVKFPFDLKTSEERCYACILYFLEENESNGNTKMDMKDLLKQVQKLTPACANHFVNCIKGNEKDIYYDKDTLDIALRKTYETEKYIADTIKNVLKINNKWDINYRSYQNKGEFPLSDEQVKALELVCNNQISILCGYAGSGKTATTNTLIQMLLDNNKNFLLLSPTGRASKVLSNYTKMPASTIHRGLLYNPSIGWGYNEENKLLCDIVIADEMSMCDIFLFKHLLEAIDFNKTKLLIIGDNFQLCSVGAGNLLNDLINSKIIPTVFLNKIFRYNDGGLMQAATDTRNCKIYLPKETNNPVILGKNKDYIFLNVDKEQMLEKLQKFYEELLNQGIPSSDIMVLSPQNIGNYGTITINNILQKIANKNCNSKKFVKIGDTIFYENDLVIQTKNNYHSKIYNENYFFNENAETLIANGESGVIKEIDKFNVIIDFNGVLIQYNISDMSSIMLGYCISTHRSQGGSAKIVIFLSCSSHIFMLNSNLMYVGLTRTKEKCFHLGNLKTINMAIKKKENLERKTFLENMLKNNY